MNNASCLPMSEITNFSDQCWTINEKQNQLIMKMATRSSMEVLQWKKEEASLERDDTTRERERQTATKQAANAKGVGTGANWRLRWDQSAPPTLTTFILGRYAVATCPTPPALYPDIFHRDSNVFTDHCFVESRHCEVWIKKWTMNAKVGDREDIVS